MKKKLLFSYIVVAINFCLPSMGSIKPKRQSKKIVLQCGETRISVNLKTLNMYKTLENQLKTSSDIVIRKNERQKEENLILNSGRFKKNSSEEILYKKQLQEFSEIRKLHHKENIDQLNITNYLACFSPKISAKEFKNNMEISCGNTPAQELCNTSLIRQTRLCDVLNNEKRIEICTNELATRILESNNTNQEKIIRQTNEQLPDQVIRYLLLPKLYKKIDGSLTSIAKHVFFPLGKKKIRQQILTKDKKELLILFENGNIQHFDINSGHCLKTIKTNTINKITGPFHDNVYRYGGIKSVGQNKLLVWHYILMRRLNNNNNYIRKNCMAVWDIKKGKQICKFQPLIEEGIKTALQINEEKIITAPLETNFPTHKKNRSCIHLWNTETGEHLKTFINEKPIQRIFSFGKKNRFMAICYRTRESEFSNPTRQVYLLDSSLNLLKRFEFNWSKTKLPIEYDNEIETILTKKESIPSNTSQKKKKIEKWMLKPFEKLSLEQIILCAMIAKNPKAKKKLTHFWSEAYTRLPKTIKVGIKKLEKDRKKL